MEKKKVNVGIVAGSAGDWGGASRVLYTNLRLLNLDRIRPIVMLPKEGPIIADLKARGIEYVIWGGLTELGNFGGALNAALRMFRFIRGHKLEVIHVNQADSWRPVELLVAKFLGVPVVTHLHTADNNPSPYVKQSSAILAVSEFVARHSSPELGPKYVVHNPVDLGRFDTAKEMRGEWGFGNDEILISFVGQIREIKGVGDFIAMAHRIDRPNARFLIAGECRDPKKFAGAYSEADLERAFAGDERFRYLGYLEQIQDLYHTSDIIVMPSRWQEPLGLIGIEAGACGKPVVATRSGGIPEVVLEGETGLLVEIGDVEGLAQSVRVLIDDRDLRRKMGEAARARVEANFTTAPVHELEAIYEKLAGR